MKYDSTADTLLHIKRVNEFLGKAAAELIHRGNVHDASKLVSPEKEYFDEFTPRLATVEYGTEAYRSNIEDLRPALDHHFANNSHHSEFYENGINGMDLFDLMEMFFDWKAATERGPNGDLLKSIDINAERKGISKQLRSILINTANRY